VTTSSPIPPEAVPCRVCGDGEPAPFWSGDGLTYRRCPACHATLLDAYCFLDGDAEAARYRLHQNDPEDPEYQSFLNRLAEPLLAQLPPRQTGLDYGCGPGPALANLLIRAGHDVRLYDPLFHPDPTALTQTYDFITCSETAEHFHRPGEEFDRLRRLIRPGGWLAIMTSFQTDDARFPDWHYRRDPTHVTFYRQETFAYLAAQWGWSCLVPRPNVVIMQKMGGG
jgi:SAM-dependent methyltransferase